MTFTTFRHSAEIRTAVVQGIIDYLQDDLGIVTVESAKPQADGGPRAYKREELPAVYVSVRFAGREESATYQPNLIYTATFGIATYNANPSEAADAHEEIRENVGVLFTSSLYQGRLTVLASGSQIWFDALTPGDLEHAKDKSPFTFLSKSTFRVRVPWTDPQGV